MMNLNTVSEFVTLSYRIEIIANVVPLIQTTPVSLHTREAMLHQNIAYINKKNRSPLLKQIILISFLAINIIKSSNLAKYLQNKTI